MAQNIALSPYRRSAKIRADGSASILAFGDFGALRLVDGKMTNSAGPRGSTPSANPIIVDHFSVGLYSSIPEELKAQIKTLWLSYAGESHSTSIRGVAGGPALLAAAEPTFAAVGQVTGTPEGPTSDHLRVNGSTWGDLTHATGWQNDFGEEDLFTNATGIARTKASLEYCKANLPLFAFIFGWCWDMTWHNSPTAPAGAVADSVYKCRWCGSSEGGPEGDLRFGLDAEDTAITGNSISIDTYLSVIQEIIDYCTANTITTKIAYSTGPVDLYDGENAYQRHLKHERIRNHVAARTAYLFDFADILAWNNAGSEKVNFWTDGEGGIHPYQYIADDNLLQLDGSDGTGVTGYHFGERGALRLGKAIWVMLARMLGWTPTISGTPTITSLNVSTQNVGSNIVITGTNLTGTVSVKINGFPCSVFTVDSATQITARVPTGATTGIVSVYNAAGKAVGPTLTVTIPLWTQINVDTDGVSGDYATLDAALAALPNPFTGNIHIDCYATTGVPDTLTSSRTLYTTAGYRLTIIRHAGYKLAFANADRLTLNHATGAVSNVTFQDFIFEKTAQAANYQQLVYLNGIRDGTIIFDRCYFLGASTTYADRMLELGCSASYNAVVKFTNCRFVSRSSSTAAASAPVYFISNRPYWFTNCLFRANKAWYTAAASVVVRNCLIKTAVAGEAISASSNYNSFSGAFSTGGANDRQGQTFTFADEAGLNFHLGSGDTGAKDYGMDMSGDANTPLTVDADGTARSGTWDIGPYVA